MKDPLFTSPFTLVTEMRGSVGAPKIGAAKIAREAKTTVKNFMLTMMKMRLRDC